MCEDKCSITDKCDIPCDISIGDCACSSNHIQKRRIAGISPENWRIKPHFLLLLSSILLFILGFTFQSDTRLKLLFLGLSYTLSGWDIVLKAVKNILKGMFFDENFLMTLASLGAFMLGEHPEAAAVMLFYKTGEILQDAAVNKSRKSIRSLMDIKPDYANLKTENGVFRVSPVDVTPGELIIVKPGEKVPLDCTVEEGNSFIDTTALTGESVPREVHPGDTVLSGSVNVNGVITARVTKSFSQSTVSRILELARNAAERKAPAEKFITRFAHYYTPGVVAAAFLTAVIPPVVLGSYDFGTWLHRSLVFLVISCPCALVISIPLSFFGGIGGASRKGILIKGGNYLEALNNVDTIIFDKTGTLTRGVFKVSDIVPAPGFTKEYLLELAAHAEVHSNHPIAKSIMEAYGKQPEAAKIEQYEEIGGLGIKAVFNGRNVLAGTERLIRKHIGTETGIPNVEGTVLHISVDNQYAGYITVSDDIKKDSAAAITQLKAQGVARIVMLTGDSEYTARKVGNELGLDEVYSELLPHQKVEQLERLQDGIKGRRLVAFAGDGINDAPVIARADIGIAMGALGSDAAIEAADIVLMTDEPSKLVEALKIAKRTRNVVWQNIVFALGVKLIIMALGVGGFASMWEAVFADVGVALAAVFNTLRLIK
jgi:Cd2+/Zn2+-exporting ATPase